MLKDKIMGDLEKDGYGFGREGYGLGVKTNVSV